MNLIVTNQGGSDIHVASYEPSYPVTKELIKGPEWDEYDYTILRGHKHKQKTSLIANANQQVDFPIFIENVQWTWIKIEEFAYRGSDSEERNRDLKNHIVNVKSDPHNFTVFTYKKQEPDLQDDPFLEKEDVMVKLEGGEFVDTAKDNFHQQEIDLDLCLMNDKPTKPEDVNSPVWLYILRGTY